ncbi:type IV pilus assembly protein PilE [Cupriavidus necator N-1]|uniref:Type IV pilus assembly protein PilE n=1 Tax=Cupriavidus necator (strain ATCC 43291 / DSM 13513 / CCUG 52238 / LMG 8453 / N-1) TaxID=1042878 RepID=G0ET54_CUPNN|nr:type IV pilus assembly protein PilE [Cupriavidus necator N-1]
MRGWPAQARTALTEGMLQLERHAVGAMTFFAAEPGAEVAAGEWPLPVPAAGIVRHIVTAAACPQAALDTCVELHAVPQRPDPECGVLILRSTGQWLALPEGEAVPRPLPSIAEGAMARHALRRRHGLTLAELLAGLAVLALLAAASYPVFSGLLARQQVTPAADRLAASLAPARATALARRLEVTLQPLPGEATLGPGWQLVTADGDPERRAVLSVVEPGMPCLWVTAPDRPRHECAEIPACGILSI